MYPFLPIGTARDAVASQFEATEPIEHTEPAPAADTTEAPARRRRSNPLRALVTHTGVLATRATWSPTR